MHLQVYNYYILHLVCNLLGYTGEVAKSLSVLTAIVDLFVLGGGGGGGSLEPREPPMAMALQCSYYGKILILFKAPPPTQKKNSLIDQN